MRTYANLLGEEDAGELLEQTLKEEKETDQKLTKLAEKINVEAEGSGQTRGRRRQRVREKQQSGTRLIRNCDAISIAKMLRGCCGPSS